jgi:hypothetical protein
MRMVSAWLVGVVVVSGVVAQAPKAGTAAKRYGVEPNLDDYPQSTPQEALASVLKAIDNNKIAYLLAHLADPKWVDERVQQIHGGKFEALVEETTSKLANDRSSVKELRRFLQEGKWEVTDNTASAQVKDIKNRQVYLRKQQGRWFLESRQQAQATAKEK